MTNLLAQQALYNQVSNLGNEALQKATAIGNNTLSLFGGSLGQSGLGAVGQQPQDPMTQQMNSIDKLIQNNQLILNNPAMLQRLQTSANPLQQMEPFAINTGQGLGYLGQLTLGGSLTGAEALSNTGLVGLSAERQLLGQESFPATATNAQGSGANPMMTMMGMFMGVLTKLMEVLNGGTTANRQTNDTQQAQPLAMLDEKGQLTPQAAKQVFKLRNTILNGLNETDDTSNQDQSNTGLTGLGNTGSLGGAIGVNQGNSNDLTEQFLELKRQGTQSVFGGFDLSS